MDSPPSSHRSEPRSRTKSASRLARTTGETENETEQIKVPLDLVSYSPSKNETETTRTLSPKPLHELLLLSPPRIRRSSKTRLIESGEDNLVEPNGSRRRYKSRNVIVGCASPRISRRSQRQEAREDRDLIIAHNNNGKPRKTRHSGRSRKEKLLLTSSSPSTPSPKEEGGDGDGCNFDRIGHFITDLIMWNDVAKSSLWFGFGSLCFLSSCFARGISFSMFSAISQLGLLFLGVSFFSNSVSQRNDTEVKREIKLTEEDILRVGRLILPAANLAISKTRQLFSGEPSMTLKVAPLLLLGAEYGHLITLKSLCALGFFASFTGPKLYSSYSVQINNKVEFLKSWVMEAWGACSHKKIVAASAVTAFWNLTGLKTRIFAAFISLVIVRYNRQNMPAQAEEVYQEQ